MKASTRGSKISWAIPPEPFGACCSSTFWASNSNFVAAPARCHSRTNTWSVFPTTAQPWRPHFVSSRTRSAMIARSPRQSSAIRRYRSSRVSTSSVCSVRVPSVKSGWPEDLNLDRRLVALKALKPRSRSTAEERQRALEILRNEAGLLSKVKHRNVNQVFFWVQSDGNHFHVLNYVAGGSLGGRMKRDGSFGWQDAARYIADVGEGLQAVHA